MKKWFGKKHQCDFIHQEIQKRIAWFFSGATQVHYIPKNWVSGEIDQDIVWQKVNVVCFPSRLSGEKAWWRFIDNMPHNAVLFILESTNDQSRQSMCQMGDEVMEKMKVNVVMDQVKYRGDIPWLKDQDIMIAQVWQSTASISDQWIEY